jgi:branched-chain amino acid aminotransferase
MAVDTSARTTTWTYVDGEWISGNPPLIGPVSHAMWLGSTVFDGARWFDGIAPDLDAHCRRVNRSAAIWHEGAVSAEEIERLTWEGIGQFDGDGNLPPMYWAEHGEVGSVVAPDPASTRFALCLFEAPMHTAKPHSLTLSPYRRPTPECAMTDAKTGSLYPNSGRMIVEARARGFDNALVRDMNGNIAETASSNVFMVKDGVVFTPAANRTFLAGITRARVIGLLREAGYEVRRSHAVDRDSDAERSSPRQLFQSRAGQQARQPRTAGGPGRPQGAGTLHGLGTQHPGRLTLRLPTFPYNTIAGCRGLCRAPLLPSGEKCRANARR